MKAKNASDTFENDTEDLKSEVLAFAQKTTFPNKLVPLLLIYANRFMYRPLIYFKKYDVLLTTPRVIQHRISQSKVYALGLMLMYTLFNTHHVDVVSFSKEYIKAQENTGFRKALKGSGFAYDESTILFVEPTPKVPLIGVTPYIHDKIVLPSLEVESAESSDEALPTSTASAGNRSRKGKEKAGSSTLKKIKMESNQSD